MGWPSKDPDDYVVPGRWEGRERPLWVQIATGRGPDAPPRWMNLTASLIGVAIGAGAAAATGAGKLLWLCVGAGALALLFDVGWWIRRRRRSRPRPARPPGA